MTACKRCHGDGFAECRCVTEVPERKPSAGWVEGDGALPGDIMLHVGRCIAAAGPGGSWVVAMLAKSVDGAPTMTVVAQGKASSRIAAQLAAEDALLAIAAEIVGAVGRSAAVNARRLVEEYGNACAAAPAAISACVDGGCDAVDSMTSTIDRGNAARDELLRALGVKTP